MKVLLSRDSVSAGDDCERHDKALSFPASASLQQIFSEVLRSGYLPHIAGGKATWSAFAQEPLAVLAQEWSEFRPFLHFQLLDEQLRREGSKVHIHFNYHAQIDPDLVHRVLWRIQIRPAWTMKDEVAYYREGLVGSSADSAWHSLVDLGPAALDELHHALRWTTDLHLRRALLSVIVAIRRPESASLFGSLLRDKDTEIWRSALDGLVTLGTDEAARILESARTTPDEERRLWIEEALGQLRNGPFSPPPREG